LAFILSFTSFLVIDGAKLVAIHFLDKERDVNILRRFLSIQSHLLLIYSHWPFALGTPGVSTFTSLASRPAT
jgi:hypothetical protein